jgi:predicted GNAT family acetyltransferase
MVFVESSHLDNVDTSKTIQLTPDDLDDMVDLYTISYPGNWFDERMLLSGQYFGIRDHDGQLVSVGGIHVYSPTYQVAALGNITTHPDFRNHGLGTSVIARLCSSLLQRVETIGLNVRTNNNAAIRSYQKLGFENVAIYHEYMLESKP